jgi:NitT/TauT family transport system substrate-binding protein
MTALRWALTVLLVAWLMAELDAQLYLAHPANSQEVIKMAKGQTSDFSERALWFLAVGHLPGCFGRQAGT